MPKRTNPFQKLIHLIYTQLVPHAVVSESEMIPMNTTGKGREVDVWFTAEIGGHSINVGIECRAGSRPTDETVIEQLAAKHQKLGTNKLIIIATAGFTAASRDEAARFAVDVLTYKEAAHADWFDIVQRKARHAIAQVSFQHVVDAVLVNPLYGLHRVPVTSNTQLFIRDSDDYETVQSCANRFMLDAKTRETVDSIIKDDGVHRFNLTARLPQGPVIRFGRAQQTVKFLIFRVRAERTTQLVQMSFGVLGARQIMHTEMEVRGAKVMFALTLEEGKEATASMRTEEPGKEPYVSIIDSLPILKSIG